MLAATYPLLNIFWSILFFFVFFLWIFLLITILIDLFSSHDLNGWVKALWVLFIIVLPFLGVLVYLIARGGKMNQHRLEMVKQQQQAFDQAVQQAGGTNRRSTAQTGRPQR